ncbi:MAG: MerR family transcriptional regulator [Deltaproteobacteria bacterium]|nr:MerR family transcriptional regulator [Deltaproteobacteria bacterium]
MKNTSVIIPDKFYFKIGEVADLLDLPTHVLRFWESEFSKIKPKRTSAGQRLYRKKDVELLLEIKYLLYEKKYTISGAKNYLKTRRAQQHPQAPAFDEILNELAAIRQLLERY